MTTESESEIVTLANQSIQNFRMGFNQSGEILLRQAIRKNLERRALAGDAEAFSAIVNGMQVELKNVVQFRKPA